MVKRKRMEGEENQNKEKRRKEQNEGNQLIRENKSYLEYYKLQQIIHDDDEDEFLKTMVFASFFILFVANGFTYYISSK